MSWSMPNSGPTDGDTTRSRGGKLKAKIWCIYLVTCQNKPSFLIKQRFRPFSTQLLLSHATPLPTIKRNIYVIWGIIYCQMHCLPLIWRIQLNCIMLFCVCIRLTWHVCVNGMHFCRVIQVYSTEVSKLPRFTGSIINCEMIPKLDRSPCRITLEFSVR